MTWNVASAKARLSELLKKTRSGPQVIENRGEPVAVVLSKAEYDRLQSAAAEPRPTAMREFLDRTAKLRGQDGLELELPPRRVGKGRPAVSFDD
jgi:prevent-host-death family protein